MNQNLDILKNYEEINLPNVELIYKSETFFDSELSNHNESGEDFHLNFYEDLVRI